MKNITRRMIPVFLCLTLLFSSFVFVSAAETAKSVTASYISSYTKSPKPLYLYAPELSDDEIEQDIESNNCTDAIHVSDIVRADHDYKSPATTIVEYEFRGVLWGDYRLALCKTDGTLYSIFDITIDSETVDLGEFKVSGIGDVNEDFDINLMDVVALLKYSARWEVEINLEKSDVNHDGKVDLLDASKLMKYCAGWDLPVVG